MLQKVDPITPERGLAKVYNYLIDAPHLSVCADNPCNVPVLRED